MARMALDQFILWVNAETPYKTAKEYIAAVKERSGGSNRMKMGGTGSAQEDQIITIQLEQALGVKFTYVPFKGGGEVCVNLVGKHLDSTVNNPDRVRQPLEEPERASARRLRHRAYSGRRLEGIAHRSRRLWASTSII